MTTAHDILQWVRRNGEVMAISRLSVRMMEAILKERLPIRSIDASTTCSAQFLDTLRKEAGVVVGKPYPDEARPETRPEPRRPIDPARPPINGYRHAP